MAHALRLHDARSNDACKAKWEQKEHHEEDREFEGCQEEDNQEEQGEKEEGTLGLESEGPSVG